jgi:hypothetical protein
MTYQVFPDGNQTPYKASHNMDSCIPSILPIDEVVEYCDLSCFLSKPVKLLGKKNRKHCFSPGLPSGNPEELGTSSYVPPCLITRIFSDPVARRCNHARFQAKNFGSIIYRVAQTVAQRFAAFLFYILLIEMGIFQALGGGPLK